MARELNVSTDGSGLRIGIVLSRFNTVIVDRLLDGAIRALESHGVDSNDILVARVPGAFELPLVARRMAASGQFDAILCLGAVVRGETPHFDYVAGESARGITDASAETGVPILFGVLTTDDMQQAMARSGGDHSDKGKETALASIEMANVMRQLEGETSRAQS